MVNFQQVVKLVWQQLVGAETAGAEARTVPGVRELQRFDSVPGMAIAHNVIMAEVLSAAISDPRLGPIWWDEHTLEQIRGPVQVCTGEFRETDGSKGTKAHVWLSLERVETRKSSSAQRNTRFCIDFSGICIPSPREHLGSPPSKGQRHVYARTFWAGSDRRYRESGATDDTRFVYGHQLGFVPDTAEFVRRCVDKLAARRLRRTLDKLQASLTNHGISL